MIVQDAITAFGSVLRAELIRHYLATPSTQAQAARTLNVHKRSVSHNTAELVAVGVVVPSTIDAENSARTVYTVDRARLKALHAALQRYTSGRTVSGN